ncbi:hypothetical protein EJ03DRAFT_307496 [Teratosphaeria nubilosa]|uniref:SNF2 family helicase n=1 Tax=Teratosphaeria nubilosa TaxID=161662 RepID=A0A6G1LHT1_9PEZI|nr:hypothetical protein EJ03DRAFT_307496 [Teratosphaeria nubilosa]
MDEIVSSTQAAAGNDELTLYGELATKIVGVQYYCGMATAGEYIVMKREPSNPYDSNAIRIDNVAQQQIGHIPRRIAEKLARYVDSGWVACEGCLAGSIGPFDCPLAVNLFGPDPQTDAGKQLIDKLKADKLPLNGLRQREQEEKKRLAEERKAAAAKGKGKARIQSSQNAEYANQSGPPTQSSQPVMEELLKMSQRFNPRQAGSAVDGLGMEEENLKNMPAANKPQGIKTDMLPYQLQALQWLLDQEDPQLPPPGSQDPVQLWKRDRSRKDAFHNIATNYATMQTPTLASGGILADDMGLGKTLEMISLLVTDAEKNGKGTTLIVCPLSVMSNWSGQIKSHVHPDKMLDIYIYHGPGRVKMDSEAFKQFDVVITTYQTLATDYTPKGKGAASDMPKRELRKDGLYSVDWRRVILDEGHQIRNPKSKGAYAVQALTARSRWVLTGTPIVNSLKDLYTLLRFIGITGGLEQMDIFNRALTRPLKAGDQSTTYLLRVIMTAFTLRRRKEMAFVDLRLPDLEEYVHKIKFTEVERRRYLALDQQARKGVEDYQRAGKNSFQQYSHLLEILLRMRQCCNHWQLCGERITKLMEQLAKFEKQKKVELNPETTKLLQAKLQLAIESQDDCPLCLDALHDPVITVCKHVFGKQCIAQAIETQHKCPMCREPLADIESTCLAPANEGGDEAADDEMDLTESSSKLDAVMDILTATKGKAEGEKTVIFSQWTRFLDVLQARLDREGIKYCRLDGTMNASQRDASLNALEHDSDCTVMLASLGVCAVGLNLTAANQIILSDTWWAPAIEDQAVDRVHRLGQKKECRVFRLVMDGSIEEKTIAVQQEKRKLMQLAFAEREGTNKREKVKTGRLADIQRLLASQPSV